MEKLIEPFQFPFMVDAMIVGVAVGAVCAVLSCYLVLKGKRSCECLIGVA